MKKLFLEKLKFEQLLVKYKIQPLTLAYHGSIFCRATRQSDFDAVLIVDFIRPVLFKKLHKINKQLKTRVGISLLSTREAGTIFGGLKYLDALCRNIGREEKHPYGYYKIAALNELFRRSAIEMNVKKCARIAKIITKTINNLVGCDRRLNVKNFDALIISLEKNLNFFYDCEKIKIGARYKEDVKIFKK